MNLRKTTKRMFALSLAFAMGTAWIPGSSMPVTPIYAAEEESGKDMLAGFDFNSGISGWYYGKDWAYQYSAADSSVAAEDGRLKFHVDYTSDKDKDWSQAAAVWEAENGNGMNLSGSSSATLDFIYDASRMTTGSFAVKLFCEEGLDAYADVDFSSAQAVDGNIQKVPVTISYEALGQTASNVKKLAVQLIGKNTDYKGAVWFDDIQMFKKAQADTAADSTIAVKSADTQQVRISDAKLITKKKDGSTQETAVASEISLVDKKADDSVKKVYAYLQAVGESDSVIYGHQNDTFHKAGSLELTNSDTKDVTGSIAGIFGIDTLSLTGNEYSVERYNKEFGSTLEQTAENNVKAAAILTNNAIKEGAIATLSAHMPNFANVRENPDYKNGEPAYAKYNFSGYSVNDTANTPANQILPGGKHNKVYTAYLDMIADYAKQVDGAILFRPYHENTGSWFWWGAAFCEPETYKNIYRYTVEYLRDTKHVHNMLYEYGPSNTGTGSVKEYGLRYPGDGYVDLVGFDMYDQKPADDGVFMGQFKKQLEILESFARKHGKLLAVTETGAANDPAPGDNQTALLRTGNGNQDWYNQVLDLVSESGASYYLLWANFSKTDGFYTPYVDSVNENGSLHGHEMLDGFISFYNDERSIFAANQREALASGDFGTLKVKAAVAGADGYLTSPIAGQRILKATAIKAKVTGASAKTKVKFVLKAGKNKVSLNAASDGKGYYTAKLTEKQLKTIGKGLGTLAVYIDGKKIQSVAETYNIKAPKEDPYLIDGFENYYGVDDQLTKAWTTNADSDCKVTLTLTKSRKSDGDYGLEFTYDETANGWGGATISKNVDWSECNALQFYMVPDGKNQKTVIQINAGGVTYEAYLNTYDAFVENGKKAVIVTVPFTEFCERDTEGSPKGGLAKDSKDIQSFGLWVNAIPDSAAISDGRVKGTLYYDQITAVNNPGKEVTFKIAK